jgi:Asp-tRNA(Asn)/Glu-tRNA(Gln) amidotransferase A subunit family amidase
LSAADLGSPFSAYSVEGCRARIRARNDELNAVLRVLDPPQVDPEAEANAPLAGVPYVLKDTWDTAGIVTTGGSWRHRERVPEVSSHSHRALAGAGAVLLGKSNLCDLAFSAESDNHMRGPVRNPHDLQRTAGGSTGGGAAAVADGMAAFDWGTDFGGSIRAPAAFCGVVGLRLSHAAWPVGIEHFPRISPFFWDFCGMGPLTKTVPGARRVTHAVSAALRDPTKKHVAMDPGRVVIYAPDRAHEGEWPTFTEDTIRLLDHAGIAYAITRTLPSPSTVNALFTEYLASHFKELIAGDELPVLQALPAVLLALVSGGRFDKRVHRNTALLFAGTAGLSLRFRNRERPARALAKLCADASAIWERGTLILTPTCTARPPRHGGTAWAYRLMTFCKLGNMTDATGLALPFGSYPERASERRGWSRWSREPVVSPAMPRSLQILGPPGSENAVLDFAEHLETAIATAR